MRLVAAVFTLLFGIAVFVNLNDPDAVRWIALYAAATGVAAWRALSMKGPPWVVPALVALIALAWAASYAPRVIGQVGFGALWSAWEMKNTRIEEGREFYGLCIVAAAMILLAAVRPRRA
jgi:hypothetical protein